MLSLIRSLALLAAISVAPLLHAENLVPNPGFEDGQDGWVLFVPPINEGAKVQWVVVNDDPHSGAACLSMKSDEPIRWAVSSKKAFKVSPGEKYRVQAWVKYSKDAKIEPGAPGANIRVTLVKLSPSDPLGHIHVGLAGVVRSSSVRKLNVPQLPSGWQKIEAVIEIPADNDLVDLSLFSQGVAGTMFWDDVSFELVDPNTPLSKVLE